MKSGQYLRVHGDLNKTRSWVIKKSDYDGLLDESRRLDRDFGDLLKERFALSSRPTKVSSFNPPDDLVFKVRKSTVNPMNTATPQQIQYELLHNDLDDIWFNVTENLPI
jgi:hypothetical protein